MKRKTIIISDLHLWAPDAQHQRLLKFLEKNTCENLILNGDIIDGRYLKFFWKRKPEYDLFFKKLKDICAKNKTTMQYVRGNHEDYTDSIRRKLWLPPLQEEIVLSSHGKEYLVCHGDEFETGTSNLNLYSLLWFFASTAIRRIDRHTNPNYGIKSHITKLYKRLTHPFSDAHKLILKKFKNQEMSGVICGHSHIPQDKIIWHLHYLNSWDRIETCSALVQDDKGNWKILYW